MPLVILVSMNRHHALPTQIGYACHVEVNTFAQTALKDTRVQQYVFRGRMRFRHVTVHQTEFAIHVYPTHIARVIEIYLFALRSVLATHTRL
jgi:hypothetical protein